MEFNLNRNQRIAIAQFLTHLSSNVGEWNKDELSSMFSQYDLNFESSLEQSVCMQTLNSLPSEVKMDIVRMLIFNDWDYSDGNDSNLVLTMLDIMYYNIGSGIECVLFNSIKNLASYFDADLVSIEPSFDTENYSIQFNLETPMLDLFESEINITASYRNEIPYVRFSLSDELLKTKMNFSQSPSQEDVSGLLKYLRENSIINPYPWMHLDYSLECNYSGSYIGGCLNIAYNDIRYSR